MRLLLTNDDGFDAPGLEALWRAAVETKNVFFEPHHAMFGLSAEQERETVSGYDTTVWDLRGFEYDVSSILLFIYNIYLIIKQILFIKFFNNRN